MVFTTFTGSISIPMNTRGFMTGEEKHCTESEGAGMTEIDATLQVIALAFFLLLLFKDMSGQDQLRGIKEELKRIADALERREKE